MEITGNTFVLLWSPHQKQFHVETVAQMLKTNMRIYASQNLGDYVVLSFEESREAAHETRKQLQELQETHFSTSDAEAD